MTTTLSLAERPPRAGVPSPDVAAAFQLRPGSFTILLALSLLVIPQGDARSSDCTPAPPGLVGWWPGDGFVLDVAGTNHGALQNGAGYAPGKVGQAFNFDGTGGSVRLPNNFFPFPTSGTSNRPFTFQVWFRTAAGGVIIGQQTGEANTSVSGLVPGLYVGTDGKLRAEVFWSGSPKSSP